MMKNTGSKMTVMKALRNSAGFDSVSRNRDGNVVVRSSFFYRNGITAQNFESLVRSVLNRAGLIDKYHVVESGEVWKAFSGGASVARGSHRYIP